MDMARSTHLVMLIKNIVVILIKNIGDPDQEYIFFSSLTLYKKYTRKNSHADQEYIYFLIKNIYTFLIKNIYTL